MRISKSVNCKGSVKRKTINVKDCIADIVEVALNNGYKTRNISYIKILTNPEDISSIEFEYDINTNSDVSVLNKILWKCLIASKSSMQIDYSGNFEKLLETINENVISIANDSENEVDLFNGIAGVRHI